jgi:LacI family transcriptional regulator
MSAKKKSVTMKDVAAAAGVSIKTVSNVVNDWPYVTPETRQKVQQAIEEVGYRRNQTARSLVTGKTHTIGVVIPDISNPFFGTAIRGCEDSLYESGYNLFLCNTNEDVQRERYNLDLLVGRGVDALILWGTRLCCEELGTLIDPELPLVTVELEDEPFRPNHACINVKNVEGACQATQHLIEQGYRRIGHLAGPAERITAQQRVQGYQQTLREAGMRFRPEWMCEAPPSISGGYVAALDLLRRAQPEAVFCYNDLMAIGAYVAARELDLEIPQDLAVVGFDDIVISSLLDPPLTTVRIAQYELGQMAGKVTLDLLLGKQDHPTTIPFPVSLKVRRSSGKTSLSPEDERAMWKSIVA